MGRRKWRGICGARGRDGFRLDPWLRYTLHDAGPSLLLRTMITPTFILLLLVQVPTAPGTPAETGEQLYEAGEQAYFVGDFDEAIVKFEAAFRASKLAAILYN